MKDMAEAIRKKLFGVRAGVTLTELMVAMSILTIGVVSMMGSFKYINQAMLSSRIKTIATNLAQEKMEVLKNKPYAQLLVTTFTATSVGYTPNFAYDAGNYVPEVFNVWGMPTFTRAVNVDYVSVSGASVSTLLSTADDPGMKKISVYVYWSQGGYPKKVQLDSYYENPTVEVLNTGFKGQVTSGGNPFQNALVQVQGAPRWRAYSDVSGNYTFQVAPGTYTLVCSSAGYYTQVTPGSLSVTKGVYTTYNFPLTAIATGTVGAYYLYTPNNHLLISQVVASTTMVSGENIEYIELFNGTTMPFDIGSNSDGNKMKLSYMGEAGASQDLSEFDLIYVTTWVAPGKFYLISNASPFTAGGSAVVADAVMDPSNSPPCTAGSPISCIHSGKAGAVILKDSDDNVVDKVGWSHTATGKPAPDALGTPYPLFNGMEAGYMLWRFDRAWSAPSGYGRAYNSGSNYTSFYYWAMNIGSYPPYSTASGVKSIITGKPATSSYIYADDGNSTGVRSFDYTYGLNVVSSFTLVGVATGTWKVTVVSGDSTQEIGNVVVTQNAVTMVPNGATVPTYIAGNSVVIATSPYTGGFVSGYVYGADSEYSVRLANKLITSDGGSTTRTSSTGLYTLNVPTGTVVITANANYSDSNYMMADYTATVAQGAVTYLPDFHLSKGGFIKGFVTSGTGALPNIVAQATNGGPVIQDVSDNTGYFYLFVSTSNTPYTISADLDPLQSFTSAPTSPLTATVNTAGATVFAGTITVVGAMGTISGTVTKAGAPITTGVLVIASTAAIPSPPPTITASAAPAQSIYYTASSQADGTYSVEVRGVTGPNYKMTAFYPIVNPTTGAVSYSTVTKSGITVSPGGTVTGQNFLWP